MEGITAGFTTAFPVTVSILAGIWVRFCSRCFCAPGLSCFCGGVLMLTWKGVELGSLTKKVHVPKKMELLT